MEMVLMFGLAYSAVILLVAVPSGLRLQSSCDDLTGHGDLRTSDGIRTDGPVNRDIQPVDTAGFAF